MKVLPLVLSFLVFLLGGCLTTPVGKTGGPGSITVQNSNPFAILNAAQTVFAESGYSGGPGNFPESISFEKPAGAMGKLFYGSYGNTTTIRVKISMVQIPGTNDYRLVPHVSRVTDAGQAGFEDDQRMLGMWSGQFKPLLRKVAAQAGGAGPV